MSHLAQSLARRLLVADAPDAVQDPPRPAQPPPEPTSVDGRTVETGRDQPLAAPRTPRPARRRQRLALAGVLLLSAALNLYGLDRLGYGNQYYAATVLSMLQSWHNFFFASFDPGGYVSVDKPPLGFWIQAASARLLGFSGLSILLPQALAGVASVAVLYRLVGRAFGPVAGLLAALALALTPVSVVTSRNNTVDSLLVLAVLLAAWAALRATERGRLGWLLLSATLIGLGFAIKMLQAYLVVPAIYLTYLAAAPRRRLVRIGHLALASVVLLAVSLAWPVAVDLTPEDRRPYVGSTQDNSAVGLALGYNGIQRLLGHNWSAGRAPAQGATRPDAGFADAQQPGAATGGDAPSPGGAGGAPATGAPFGGGPGGSGENGTPGPLRLLNQQLAGQASWLLPLALAGLLVTGRLARVRRRSLARSRPAQAFFLWGSWLATTAAFFSVAGFFHRYYLVMLAPPVAALAGIGVWEAWRAYRRGRRLGWLLPTALLATGALQARILADYPDWGRWLTPVALGAVVAGLVLLALRPAARALGSRPRLALGAPLAAGLGTLALLVAPAVWVGLPAATGQGGGGLPAAGPAPQRGAFPGPNGAGAPGFGGPGRAGGGFGAPTNQADLIAYLQAQQGDDPYLVATTSSMSASPIILATAEPVMALGGFSGGDPILTVEELADRVRAGEVRFFLVGGGPGDSGGRGGSGLTAWVQSACGPVPTAAIGGASDQPATEPPGSRRPDGRGQLYDCGGLRGASA